LRRETQSNDRRVRFFSAKSSPASSLPSMARRADPALGPPAGILPNSWSAHVRASRQSRPARAAEIVHQLDNAEKDVAVDDTASWDGGSRMMDRTDIIIQSAARTVDGAGPEVKLKVFALQVRDLLGFVQNGIAEKTCIVHALREIAESNELIASHGQNAIDAIMAAPTMALSEMNQYSGEEKTNKRSTVLQFDRIADIEPEAVQWIWPKRIAHGKLTLISGDPGIGKSQIATDITARITTGGTWRYHPLGRR
jgi:AAA domain